MRYLDHAATTPMRPSARIAWNEAAAHVGNPSSLHTAGRAARRLVEESRELVAAAVGVAPSAVVFTSGATEADNLAVTGTYRARSDHRRTLLASAIEHKAVLEPLEALERDGAKVVSVPVDDRGVVDPDRVADVLGMCGDEVASVAAMWVNNEVGSIQPIEQLAAICVEQGLPLHVDAVQALGVLPVDLSLATTAALSAHKVGGPMGVGVLTVSPRATVHPLVHGGGHESGLRAGTLNVPGIVAAAVAIDEAVSEQVQLQGHLSALSKDLTAGLQSLGLSARVNSTPAGHPGIVNASFPGCEGDALMMLLDSAGICVSTGSACTVGIPQPSHVLMAMGVDRQDARSALRFSLGRMSTSDDVAAVLAALPDAVARARRAGLMGRSA